MLCVDVGFILPLFSLCHPTKTFALAELAPTICLRAGDGLILLGSQHEAHRNLSRQGSSFMEGIFN